MSTPDSKPELIEVIGQLNSEIYDLRERLTHSADSSPSSFLADELQANTEAQSSAVIEALQLEIAQLSSGVQNSEAQLEELKRQNQELRDLLREQQALQSDSQTKRSEPVIGGQADVEHLFSTIKGLQLQLKASRDESAFLAEELRVSEGRFSEEINRLASQISRVDQAGVKFERDGSEEKGRLLAEMEGMKRTVKSLSDNLNHQVLEGQRLHNQIVADREMFSAKLEKQEAEMGANGALVRSLQALLHCREAGQVLAEVQRLEMEHAEARKCIDERLVLERRLADEVMKNRMIQERAREMQPIVIQARPNTEYLEAEVARVREELNDREAHWKEERESLTVEIRRRDLTIEKLTEAKKRLEANVASIQEKSAIYALVFERCVKLSVHFENDFEARTQLVRELGALFTQITVGEIPPASLINIDRLASADTEQLMEIVASGFIQTNDRLARYARQMEEVMAKTEEVFQRLCDVAGKPTLPEKGSTIGRKGGTRIPLFAKATKGRAPLASRNQAPFQGFSPRTSPTTVRQPFQIRFD
jgi:hypothetical protein